MLKQFNLRPLNSIAGIIEAGSAASSCLDDERGISAAATWTPAIRRRSWAGCRERRADGDRGAVPPGDGRRRPRLIVRV
jgi:hypothetical protein